MLAKKIRSRHGPASRFSSCQTLTPRLAKSPKLASRGTRASKRPALLSRLGIERDHPAVGRPDVEQAESVDRRRFERGRAAAARKRHERLAGPVGPGELERRDVVGTDLRERRVLRRRLLRAGARKAPSAPTQHDPRDASGLGSSFATPPAGASYLGAVELRPASRSPARGCYAQARMRIDAHQHFWRYEPRPLSVDRRANGGAEARLPALRPRAAAARAAASTARSPCRPQHALAETDWLLELADRHPFVRGVVGWVDLCSPAAGRQLARLAQRPKLVGVRHIVHDEPDDDFLLRPDFRSGIARLREHALVYDLLLFPKHLPRAVRLVRGVPRAAVRARPHRQALHPRRRLSRPGGRTCGGSRRSRTSPASFSAW